MDGNGIGMTDPSHGANLVHEAFACEGIALRVDVHHLDGDGPADEFIFGIEDDALSADAQHAGDAVATDRLAHQGVRIDDIRSGGGLQSGIFGRGGNGGKNRRRQRVDAGCRLDGAGEFEFFVRFEEGQCKSGCTTRSQLRDHPEVVFTEDAVSLIEDLCDADQIAVVRMQRERYDGACPESGAFVYLTIESGIVIGIRNVQNAVIRQCGAGQSGVGRHSDQQ